MQQLYIDINENNSKKSSLKNTLINFDQKHVKYIKTTIHTETKLTFLDLLYVKIFGEVGFNDVNRAMLEVDGLPNKVALKSSVLNFLCIFFHILLQLRLISLITLGRQEEVIVYTKSRKPKLLSVDFLFPWFNWLQLVAF